MYSKLNLPSLILLQSFTAMGDFQAGNGASGCRACVEEGRCGEIVEPQGAGSSEADMVLIQDLATAFIIVVSAVVIAFVILAFILRRYWTRQASYRRRHSLDDLEFDRPLTASCRGRSLPPPYSMFDARTRPVTPPLGCGGAADGVAGAGAGASDTRCKDDCLKDVQTSMVQPPRYISIENNSHIEEGASSLNVLISNIQDLISLHTQGGEDFLRLLETQPRYLLDVLQLHQQENQNCQLNQP
eukprot:GFUD01011421.1.p1 GENE.GFUD01011421.1~~GFUD01011421.1.p1  ORF type:complete len:243 (-),score=47.87 GFUD01011421.1:90-818(-)